MGAGVSNKVLRAAKYRQLKKIQRKLEQAGIPCSYANEKVKGRNFVAYFAGCGPASNGERSFWLVLRFNPNNQPEAAVKKTGDIDYTNFHTRTIPEHSLGGWDAGVKMVQQHLGCLV